MKGNNIVLIGFMGCGKSTVGKKLAGALSYEFQDTDAMVEEAYGKTISQIFEEDVFRDSGEPREHLTRAVVTVK